MRGETNEEAASRLVGRWRASGLCEGLDMRGGNGRVSYYPVGRGGMALLQGGVFRLENINASGVFRREGEWSLKDGRLCIRLGDDIGWFCASLSDGRLTLLPERAHYRCAQRLLHRPTFERD